MDSKPSAMLAKLRRRLHPELTSLPNTLGTAIGYKRQGGTTLRKRALVVYVREKVAAEDLQPEAVIPRTIQVDGKAFATDVCVLGRLQYQFGPPPWFCRDRPDNQGTVTAMCRSASGEVFALTCAHCIEGSDRDPSTVDTVSLWDEGRRDYLRVGVSGLYTDTSGYGLPGNFGFTDWGLFSIEDENLIAGAHNATELPVAAAKDGTVVTARTAHGEVQGVVEHTQVQLPALYADVAIRITHNATFPGDSGALWCDSSGRAIAIHAIGMAGPAGSPMSFSMLASRIGNDLEALGYRLLAM